MKTNVEHKPHSVSSSHKKCENTLRNYKKSRQYKLEIFYHFTEI